MKISCTNESAKGKFYAPLAIGNGDLSMTIDYTGSTTIKFYCKKQFESGLWRAGYRLDTPGWHMLRMGYWENVLAEPSDVVSWKQTLHVTDAASESECTYENGVKIHSYVYCLLNHNLVVIRKKISGAEKIGMRYFFAPERTDTLPLSDTKTAYQVNTWEGKRGTVSFFSADSNVMAKRSKEEIFLEAASDSAVFYLAFDEEAEKFALTHTEAEIESAHRAAWADFWAESTVPAEKLPEKVLEAVRTSEYHLRISSTKWSIPTGITPYHWDGRYFAFDEFFALEGLLASGHLELARKITRFRHSILDTAQRRAHSYYGEKSSAANYIWESLETPGIEGAPAGFWLEHIFHMANIGLGAWHCSLNGKDRKFLEETAYPVMRGCAEYYRIFSICEKEKGRFVIGKCTDLERLGAARENAFMTTCGAIATLRAAAEGAEILGVDEDLRKEWNMYAEKLTETLPQDERSYLPYPGCTDKSIGLFSGIFPYGNLSADDTKQRQSIQDFCDTEKQFGNMYPLGKSICTWYAGWKAITYARLGEKEIAQTVVRQMAEETGYFSEVFEICETGAHPWFTTGEGVLIQAVCEAYNLKETEK